MNDIKNGFGAMSIGAPMPPGQNAIYRPQPQHAHPMQQQQPPPGGHPGFPQPPGMPPQPGAPNGMQTVPGFPTQPGMPPQPGMTSQPGAPGMPPQLQGLLDNLQRFILEMYIQVNSRRR
ncbi:hypothetical protein AAVH_39224 [Aphelenchoides avenae]|nr:hypothetical protein AAVH_39224 [Aphelenchus avenae]